MPQPEFSAPAWARARRTVRRRVAVGAAAAILLVAVPLAVVLLSHDARVRPAQPTYTDQPLRGRASHTATLLPDGRVLIVGGCATDGCGGADASPSTEFYVPGQGFTAGPELLQPRQGQTATLLADGRVLVTGGWAQEGTPPLDSAELFDPASGRFQAAGPLTTGRGGHSANLLPDGRVLIAGGDTDTTELFDPRTDAFVAAAPMPEPRFAAPSITMRDGRVLIAGGRDAAGRALASAVLYDPATATWRNTGAMGTPRDKHALAPLPDGRVMVLGGTPDDRELLSSTEIYDPATGEFTPGPPMDIRRYKLSTDLDSAGHVIVAGGTQVAVVDAAGSHPIPGTTGPLRWAPSVTGLPNGDVLVVGGYDERIGVRHDAMLIPASQIAQAGP